MRTLIFSALLMCFISATSFSQVGAWNPELQSDCKEALENMLKETPKLKSYKSKAYGYAVFPKVTKAGLGVGGAVGKGLVYQGVSITGKSTLKQASVGFQAGGQQYSEVIFFENKEAYDKFVNGNLKFGAQASAIAITAGASIDAAYQDGVAVFTQAIGGLMYEASLGGQHFSFKPKS